MVALEMPDMPATTNPLEAAVAAGLGYANSCGECTLEKGKILWPCGFTAPVAYKGNMRSGSLHDAHHVLATVTDVVWSTGQEAFRAGVAAGEWANVSFHKPNCPVRESTKQVGDMEAFRAAKKACTCKPPGEEETLTKLCGPTVEAEAEQR